MKQNTILLILFGVILIYYLCKSTREGVRGHKTEVAAAAQLPRHVVTSDVPPHYNDRHRPPGGGGSALDGSTTRGSPANTAASARSAQLTERQEQPPMADVAAETSKADLGPELLKKINELESTITKLKFQTKRARLQGQNIVAVDKLDMGKLSMDLFNWQKLNNKSNVDVNLILGDHIKNSAKETSVKHIISPNKKEKSCDPVADEKEQQPPVEYKGYPVFTKPEFPSTQKYELPKGAKAGPQMNIPTEKSDVNTGIPKPFNTASYDQKADAGIEKSH